jgi:hypothetical protein
MDLFPNIYEGKRPMACCGKGGGNARKNVGVNSSIQVRGMVMENRVVGSQGMEKIEYIGNQMSFTAFGDATGAKYTFGKDRPIGWVDKTDLGSRDGKNGFLSKRDKQTGRWLYKLAGSSEEKADVVAETVPSTEVTPVSEVPVVQELGMAGTTVASGTLSAVKQEKITVDPTDLNVEEIKALELSEEEWLEVYRKEMAGRNRKGAIAFLEEVLASFSK